MAHMVDLYHLHEKPYAPRQFLFLVDEGFTRATYNLLSPRLFLVVEQLAAILNWEVSERCTPGYSQPESISWVYVADGC